MQTVVEVKRIDLWSLFKVSFFVYAILGLIGGFFYVFFMMLATSIGGAFIEEEFPGIGFLGGFIGIILLPVLAFLYGAIGSVVVTICGGIINLIMRGTGGVRFDVDMLPVGGLVQAPPAAAPPTAPEPPPAPAPAPPPSVVSQPPPGGTPPPGDAPSPGDTLPRDDGSPGIPPGHSGPQT